MPKASGYAAFNATSPLGPFAFERRDLLGSDVRIEILFCGVCHSDLHTARNEWGGTQYPVVPGHEIVGRVTAVGSAVTQFKVGQVVGVGCMVDSCGHCHECREGLENYCKPGFILTYNSPDKHTGKMTYGGYSDSIVVDQRFVLRISDKVDLAATAPLLCAGITTWSPLRHWNVSRGQRVGIIGLGGLGHMGLKFAHALGAHTILFTTSAAKSADARRLGADEVVLVNDAAQMGKYGDSLDFILNTASAALDLNQYLGMLKLDGTLCLVGAPDRPHSALGAMGLVWRRRAVAGSLIGGIRQTQEMLDFCAANNIVSDIEMIQMSQINQAYERMLKGDVRYRFVIDMRSLKKG